MQTPMKRSLLILMATAVLASPGAAAPSTPDVDPSLIGPSSSRFT